MISTLCSTSFIGLHAEEAKDAGCRTVKDCAQEMVSIASDLKADNEKLHRRITQLEEALAATAKELRTERDSQWKAMREKNQTHIVNNGGNGESEVCPVGFYMVGAKWQSDGGGPHGIISWFAPVCRRL